MFPLPMPDDPMEAELLSLADGAALSSGVAASSASPSPQPAELKSDASNSSVASFPIDIALGGPQLRHILGSTDSRVLSPAARARPGNHSTLAANAAAKSSSSILS